MAGGLYRWQRGLWEALAKVNHCLYWSVKGLSKGSKYQHRLLGREVNIISVEVMAAYLEQTIERLARERFGNVPSLYFAKPGIAYREGMAERIVERLWEQRYEQEREARRARHEAERARQSGAPASTALVVTILDVEEAEDCANEDFRLGLEPGTTLARRRAAPTDSDWATEYWRRERERREKLRIEDPKAYEREQRAREAQARRDEKASERRREKREREERERPATFYEGRRVGDTVPLSQQMNRGADQRALNG
jgi:hypothetical protein